MYQKTLTLFKIRWSSAGYVPLPISKAHFEMGLFATEVWRDEVGACSRLYVILTQPLHPYTSSPLQQPLYRVYTLRRFISE